MALSKKPDRLPPLTALRAFESAARLTSFALAADELSVTPAALSYQIKQLESHLGLSLFHRMNRAVRLTEAGRRLQPGVAEGFERLRGAVRTLADLREGNTLTVTAGPAFTAKILAPRLFTFVAERPDLEVRFVASLRVMDFDRDDVDVAIRFGLHDDPALFSTRLIEEKLTPLCAPGLAARVTDAASLRALPLIQDDSLAPLGFKPEWSDWLEAAGVSDAADDPHWRRGARFSNADHAISAAAEGSGVVLARVSLAAPELRAGRLVAPFDLAIDPAAHSRLVCPKGAEERPAIRAFRDWLEREIAETTPALPGLRTVAVPRLAAAARAAA